MTTARALDRTARIYPAGQLDFIGVEPYKRGSRLIP
jgi:hypothetical protein